MFEAIKSWVTAVVSQGRCHCVARFVCLWAT